VVSADPRERATTEVKPGKPLWPFMTLRRPASWSLGGFMAAAYTSSSAGTARAKAGASRGHTSMSAVMGPLPTRNGADAAR
jgi:hypothetical protein